MSNEQQPGRAFRVTVRLLTLLIAMALVFFASFFVTLTIKSDRPMEIVKTMFMSEKEREKKFLSDLEEQRRVQRNLAELEQKKKDAEPEKSSVEKSVDETKVDEPKADKPSVGEKEYNNIGWSAKLARLRSIKSAVDERIKDREHYVPLEEIPHALRQAIVAIEDNRFYSHKGFDPEGIARATVVNVESGHIEEGGSTITQQLVKNLFLTQEQSFTRKIEEILLAIDLERNFTKDEILELYLNTIYFGSNFYGVYEAAEGYFGKEPQDLTLAECAMLAGLPQAPSWYSPYVDFLAAKNRQFLVLSAMVKAKVLTEREAERARMEPIDLVDETDWDN